jgi:hypothetical protein
VKPPFWTKARDVLLTVTCSLHHLIVRAVALVHVPIAKTNRHIEAKLG